MPVVRTDLLSFSTILEASGFIAAWFDWLWSSKLLSTSSNVGMPDGVEKSHYGLEHDIDAGSDIASA